jgi:hypothetical protein
VKMVVVLWEGYLFLRAIANKKRKWWQLPLPPKDYLLWRLGTVYGTHPTNDGTKPPKTLRDFARELWGDREQVVKFLLWRRKMRLERSRWTN